MDISSNYRWIDGHGPAFGWPGSEPRWTSSEKDAVGTAYSTSSVVWYTISHGILNEIYYPTIDRPQTRDMEFLLTDGETFIHEEKRDLKRKFEFIDPDALARLDIPQPEIGADRIAALKRVMSRAESSRNRKDADELRTLSASLEKDAASAKTRADAERMRALAGIFEKNATARQ